MATHYQGTGNRNRVPVHRVHWTACVWCWTPLATNAGRGPKVCCSHTLTTSFCTVGSVHLTIQRPAPRTWCVSGCTSARQSCFRWRLSPPHRELVSQTTGKTCVYRYYVGTRVRTLNNQCSQRNDMLQRAGARCRAAGRTGQQPSRSATPRDMQQLLHTVRCFGQATLARGIAPAQRRSLSLARLTSSGGHAAIPSRQRTGCEPADRRAEQARTGARKGHIHTRVSTRQRTADSVASENNCAPCPQHVLHGSHQTHKPTTTTRWNTTAPLAAYRTQHCRRLLE